MLPRKFFENLHTAVALLVLFEKYSGKFCLNFLPLIFECFTKYDAFCSAIFDCYRKSLKL